MWTRAWVVHGLHTHVYLLGELHSETEPISDIWLADKEDPLREEIIPSLGSKLGPHSSECLFALPLAFT